MHNLDFFTGARRSFKYPHKPYLRGIERYPSPKQHINTPEREKKNV
jgi:hypothetical protein